jgi:cobalt/nickel transport system permease protein
MGGSLSFRNFSAVENYQARHRNQGINCWNPRLKLCLLTIAVALNVVVADLRLSAALWLVGICLVCLSRIPAKLFAIFFLAPAWATLTVVIGFSIGFGTIPIFHLGSTIFYREGLISGISAACRVASDMTWMAAVFLTTPINEILEALKSFGMPEILCQAIALTYRYVFLLFDEFQRMSRAAQARGGMRNFGCRFRTTGQILSRIFLRAYDRSLNIQQAMQARGGGE